MSGTLALPQVPSARAPSSAASSARRSLHSAGSTVSHVSSNSLRQSSGDEEEEEEGDDDDEEEEDEPHETSNGSGGLWDEVENFLNKPSPSLATFAKEPVKSSTAGANVLPTIKNGDRKHPVAPSGNQSGTRASRPAARQYVNQSTTQVKAIDPRLLQEAFAYAERIQKVNFDDEEEDDGEHDQQREADRRGSGGVGMLRRDTSFGSASTIGGGPRIPSDSVLQKQGSLRTKPEDKVRKKKAATKQSAYSGSAKPQAPKKRMPVAGERRASKDASGWDMTPSSADPSGDGSTRRGSHSVMDQQTVQSLVSSLQNGTALEELRRELAASQQSMAMSRQVIQEAAKSFFRK